MTSLYDLHVKDIEGKDVTLGAYKGKTLLIVNTASACGFTPQYRGLNQMYEKYHAQGLVVLGFPCNQFGGQEPGDEEKIAEFCELNFQVKFPMFAKIDVNGKNAHPLYVLLKSAAPGILGTEAVKWNFTKFLVGPDGKVITRYGSKDTPEAIEAEVVKALPR